jgi:hypothetical protein
MKELERHLSINVVFTGHLCLGWCSNFVGSESGQKQSVKLLQNMVYNTTKHPPTPTPPKSRSTYIYIKGVGHEIDFKMFDRN